MVPSPWLIRWIVGDRACPIGGCATDGPGLARSGGSSRRARSAGARGRVAEGGAALLVERHRVGRRGALAAEERRPVVVEVAEDASARRSRATSTSAQARRRRRAPPAARAGRSGSARPRRARAPRVERDRRVPEVAHQLHLAGVVPDVGGDGAARARATRRHLGRGARGGRARSSAPARRRPHRRARRRAAAPARRRRRRRRARSVDRRAGVVDEGGRGVDAADDARLGHARIVSASAPVPQPTSSQRLPGGTTSQPRNSRATSRLQRPTYGS